MECRYCRSTINDKAKVCVSCGKNQNKLIELLRVTGLVNIVAVVAIVLTVQQSNLAKQETNKAKSAAKDAEIAKFSADSALLETQKLYRELKYLGVVSAEIAYLDRYKSFILASGKKHAELYAIRLDSLMITLEPDSIKRSIWVEDLKNAK